MRKSFVSLLFGFILMNCFAQYGYRDSNRIGISAGVNQYCLLTKNFDIKPELGWNGGLSVRGNFYNDWDMVYSMQFSENNFSVATQKAFSPNEDVKLKFSSVQISLLGSYKFIENHLSVDFGPTFQLNGKLKSEYSKENNIVSGTTLTVKEIGNISRFNFYPTIGITAGERHFRANISYQYGLVNVLAPLNSDNPGKNFKGNSSILNGNIIFYF